MSVPRSRVLQVAWNDVSASGAVVTRVRSLFREDPMTALPSRILTYIIDKIMPRSIASLRKAAIEREQNIAREQSASTGHAKGSRQPKA